MKSVFVAIAAFAATIVSAQSNIVSITSPLTNTAYTAGQNAIIAWVNPTVDVIPQIVLAKGNPSNLQVVSVIAENVDAKKGSYTWSIPADIQPGEDYALELGTSPDISFSGLFSIKAAAVESSSSTTTTSTTNSASATTTTTVTRTTTTTASASSTSSAIATAVSSAVTPAASSAISSVASAVSSSIASVATSASSAIASSSVTPSSSAATTIAASTTPTPETENAGNKMTSNKVILAIAGIAAAALI